MPLFSADKLTDFSYNTKQQLLQKKASNSEALFVLKMIFDLYSELIPIPPSEG